jgi:hypothetical protein
MIDNPSIESIEEYINIFFDQELKVDLTENKHLSMVQIQYICIRNQHDSELAIKEIKNQILKND